MKQRLYKGKTIIWKSKTKTLLLLFVSVLFAALGMLLYTDGEKLNSLVIPIFFLGYSVVLLAQLLKSQNLFVARQSELANEIYEYWSIEDSMNFKFDDDNFNLSGNLYTWDNINTIFAYKEDQLTTDNICLDIFIHDAFVLKVDESMPGWYQFIDAFYHRLSIPYKWYDVVAKPAFAANLTLIYDKTGRTQEACIAACYGK